MAKQTKNTADDNFDKIIFSTERPHDLNSIHLWFVRIKDDVRLCVDDQLYCHFVAWAQHWVSSLFGNFCTIIHTESK